MKCIPFSSLHREHFVGFVHLALATRASSISFAGKQMDEDLNEISEQV